MDYNLDPRIYSLPQMPTPEHFIPWAKQPPIQNAESKRRFIYDSHPLDLFTPTVNISSVPDARWVYTDNEGKASLFVFTDGAAPGNGQAGARAGFGVVYNPLKPGISFPLERSKEGHEPTSNRAELRAVIAAVGMRSWRGEGFQRLVIGTDSEYVIKGVSEWCTKWKSNGWKTSTGANVKNQDLWKVLLGKMEKMENEGFSVQFFQLKREWNDAADACARKGALSDNIRDEYAEVKVVFS